MAEPENLGLELLREMRADIGRLDGKIDRVDAKVDGLNERIDQVETSLAGLTHAVIAGFGALVHRWDDHESRVARLERERA